MVAYGGLGEFLFQLDLSIRIYKNTRKIKTLFLVRSNYNLFYDIVKNSNAEECGVFLINAKGFSYFLLSFLVPFCNFFREIIIINSFNSLFYRIPTRIFYRLNMIFGGQVVSSRHNLDNSIYKQIPYLENEPIWSRNKRITKEVFGCEEVDMFPLLKFKHIKILENKNYIHIHPVASTKDKSIPVNKLIGILENISKSNNITITMTPKEEVWYLTKELSEFIRKNKNITLISKYFHINEIINIISNASVFVTVNTGLLWIAVLLEKNTVVLDKYSEDEWNASSYRGVKRLSHDFDREGRSLQMVKVKHDDGEFYESMYLISEEEAVKAINYSLEKL